MQERILKLGKSTISITKFMQGRYTLTATPNSYYTKMTLAAMTPRDCPDMWTGLKLRQVFVIIRDIFTYHNSAPFNGWKVRIPSYYKKEGRLEDLKAFAVYQVFEEEILGHKETMVRVHSTHAEAQTWVKQRQSVPCYSLDKYEIREIEIKKGGVR